MHVVVLELILVLAVSHAFPRSGAWTLFFFLLLVMICSPGK